MTAGRDDTLGSLSRFSPILGPARVFLVDGRQWTVEEFVDSRTGHPSLVFSSHGVARRVRTFPPHWRQLPDADLDRLKEQT